ncbi:lytic polysaccharide monooxygenase [Plenodomus tracheiphilus IPT5]|uniref:Lytic polysaccharide monooxygenase n=1 Tax=Plenodomus tracheiphilus IPT5 TaxID=1408161 RepID=A0A6A7B8V7_9PLEO|nr:lytic polysaccharide monooxygenase [Plenodomus tracheiphilus IPT5]
MFSQATLLLALATSATAHMILEYPVPFGKATLNSSPLAPGDYPCKQRTGVYDVTEMNQWNAGETKTISFIGSAVHGGGSCQFSLTTDPKPSESSQWKVIQSVVGGCPSNVTGNIEPADPAGHGASTFPVKMPESIPDGQYTFAWTWINKIGNREFYMNCAPVQVGSASGTASTASVSAALSKLPDMFVANLPDTSCSTAEGEDFNYPDAGSNIIEGNGASLGDSLSGAGCATMTKMGAGKGQIGTPTEPETPAKSSAVSQKPSAAPAYSDAPVESAAPAYSAAPAESAAPVESEVPSNPGGVFAPGASSAPAVQPTTPAAAEPTAAPAQPSSAPTYGGAPTNGTPSGDGECTPCTEDGAVVCIGSNQFGLCNRGCAVAQDLAAGMSCSAGVVVASTKRSYFPRAHLHRRHGSARLH